MDGTSCYSPTFASLGHVPTRDVGGCGSSEFSWTCAYQSQRVPEGANAIFSADGFCYDSPTHASAGSPGAAGSGCALGAVLSDPAQFRACEGMAPAYQFYCPAANQSTTEFGTACFASLDACAAFYTEQPELAKPNSGGQPTCGAGAGPCTVGVSGPQNCSGAAPGHSFSCATPAAGHSWPLGVYCYGSKASCHAGSNPCGQKQPCISSGTSLACNGAGPGNTWCAASPPPSLARGYPPFHLRDARPAGAAREAIKPACWNPVRRYCPSAEGSSISASGTVCYESDDACIHDVFNHCAGCMQSLAVGEANACYGCSPGSIWYCNMSSVNGSSVSAQGHECYPSLDACVSAVSNPCVACVSSRAACAGADPGSTWLCDPSNPQGPPVPEEIPPLVVVLGCIAISGGGGIGCVLISFIFGRIVGRREKSADAQPLLPASP